MGRLLRAPLELGVPEPCAARRPPLSQLLAAAAAALKQVSTDQPEWPCSWGPQLLQMLRQLPCSPVHLLWNGCRRLGLVQANMAPGRQQTSSPLQIRSLGVTAAAAWGLSGLVPWTLAPAALSAAGCLVATPCWTALLILMPGGIHGPGPLAVPVAPGRSAAVTCCAALLLLGLMHECLWAPALEAGPSRAHTAEAPLAKVIAPAELPVTAHMKPAPAACSSS